MTARPSDADRRSAVHAGDSTPAPGAGDSIPATSPPAPPLPSTAAAGGAYPGAPAELLAHPDYELIRELGRGGMGVVYLARHRLIERMEVLKVVQDRLAGRPDLMQRFATEVQMAGRLQHPNVVVTYGAFRAGGALVLAMEYVEGRTLAEVVARKGPLPVAHACALARQVALGLQRAHEEGMVHRDVKPQNLMLSRRGEVKVLDFGLAKVASEETGAGGITASGVLLGTPEYMAPEQALDAKSADIRADVYSLGCTLHFLLTGRSPFAGRSPYEVMYAHQTVPPPPVPGAPAELEALLRRMLAKRPADRPQTPGEVARALGPLCQGGERRGDRVPPPLPKPLPEAPRRPAGRREALGESTVAEAPARRRSRWWGGRALAGAVVLAVGAVAAGLWADGALAALAKWAREQVAGGQGTVEGRVTYNGQPFSGATVTFHAEGAEGRWSTVTWADGSYQVRGVPVGRAVVTVEDSGSPPPGGGLEKDVGAPRPEMRGGIPARYADVRSSGLYVEVRKGTQVHDVNLSSRMGEGGAPKGRSGPAPAEGGPGS